MSSSATQMSNAAGKKPLLQVRNLKKYFPIQKGIFSRTVGHVKAVDDVSFDVYPNETLGLVGESGCGKTTTGRSLLRLIEPTAGHVLFDGENITDKSTEEMRRVRRNMQIIFQDPYSSLNPRMTVEGIIGEAIEFHGIAFGDERRRMVEDLLERVGLQPSYITRYPHEFSGGQRQRIGIARALALNPDFIVCDEAVSALDVSVQAQVINLLQDLQEEFNLSYLFIAHDLSVVQHISDRIAVMYLGQIAELAQTEELFESALHPYTQALLSAIPHPDPTSTKTRVILEGDVPSPINPPEGCRFHTRCPCCFETCKKVEPKWLEVEPEHFVKCHLYDPELKPDDPEIYRRLPNFVAELEAEQEGHDSVEEAIERQPPTDATVSGVSADGVEEPEEEARKIDAGPEAAGDTLEGHRGAEVSSAEDGDASPDEDVAEDAADEDGTEDASEPEDGAEEESDEEADAPGVGEASDDADVEVVGDDSEDAGEASDPDVETTAGVDEDDAEDDTEKTE